MNTLIFYQYRDASNYKQAHTVVVEGEVTFEQIKPYLDDGEYFIPFEVGLPELQRNWGRLDEDDHVWHELLEVEPTAARPSIEITAQQLLEMFEAAKWDVEAAMERVGIERTDELLR